MKRTSLKGEPSKNEPAGYEYPTQWSGGQRVRKLDNEIDYNRQLISNFNNLCR